MTARLRHAVTIECPFVPLRVLVGILLITAAGLKLHKLITVPAVGGGFLDEGWLQVSLVEFEIMFGVWLLYGLYPTLSRRLMLVTFAVFAMTSLVDIVLRKESCDCFGKLSVTPWIPFLLDLSIVGVLVKLRVESQLSPNFRHLAGYSVTAFLFVMPSLMLLQTEQWSTLLSDGRLAANRKVVLLTPDEWINQRLPLLPHIDIGNDLARGDWLAVLVKHDCTKCMNAIREMADRHPEPGSERVAIIELPPFAPSGSLAAPNWMKHGHVSSKHTWFVRTPLVLSLKDGVVRCTTDLATAHLLSANSGNM